MKYGKLTVIERVPSNKPGVHYLVECDCGLREVRPARDMASVVRKGFEPKCRECGLLVKAANGKQNVTHGLASGSTRKLYDVHRQMMRRCYDPACKDFHNYGGRGIEIAQEWHDCGCFIQWAISSGYCEGLTIERIDVNGGYQPNNCTWIENCRQAHNLRKTRRVCGMVYSEAEKAFGIGRYTIKGRIRNGWTESDAISVVPVKGRNQFGLPRQ